MTNEGSPGRIFVASYQTNPSDQKWCAFITTDDLDCPNEIGYSWQYLAAGGPYAAVVDKSWRLAEKSMAVWED